MPPQMPTVDVKIGLPEPLKLDAQEAAKAADLSLAQFMRAALRHCLGRFLTGDRSWLIQQAPDE